MRLPVFHTLGQTFGFVVERRFFTLLRLIWFPALISAVLQLLPQIYAGEVLGVTPDNQRYEVGVHYGVTIDADKIQAFANTDPVFQALSLLGGIGQMLLTAVIAIAIHRLILLDDRQPGTFFNLRLGREGWLYVLAWILYFILAALAFAPVIAHFAFVGYEQHWSLATWKWRTQIDPECMRHLFEDPRLQISFALGCLFMLIAITRLGLVFPAIVAEGRISFASSWRLTRGNFWRLIGFWILLAVLGGLLMMAMALIFGLAAALGIASVVAGGQAIGALGILVFSVPAIVSGLVLIVVAVTLFVAGLSFTYKALGGESMERHESRIRGPAHAT